MLLQGKRYPPALLYSSVQARSQALCTARIWMRARVYTRSLAKILARAAGRVRAHAACFYWLLLVQFKGLKGSHLAQLAGP